MTHDAHDPVLSIKSEYLKVICAETEMKQISFMNNIHAHIVVSTTPHLDIYMWKRSKNVKKYVHIFHSPTSIDFYEKYALSFYDVIFTAVDLTVESQKFLDQKRGLPEKQFYKCGCCYYDSLIEQMEKLPALCEEKTVLYAPGWGKRSSIYTISKDVMKYLLDEGYNVIFRPHPQSFISDKNILDEILATFAHDKKFRLDKNKTSLESMKMSCALITDLSGILFDYYFLCDKPIFFASDKINKNGYEIEDLPEELQFDVPYSKMISKNLTLENLGNFEQMMADYACPKDKVSLLPNFGNASKVIFNYLCELEKSL